MKYDNSINMFLCVYLQIDRLSYRTSVAFAFVLVKTWFMNEDSKINSKCSNVNGLKFAHELHLKFYVKWKLKMFNVRHFATLTYIVNG